MVHRILWRVGSAQALDFWQQRLVAAPDAVHAHGRSSLRFADPEGLEHELLINSSTDEPLIAEAPDVPRELALQGFEGVRAYAHSPRRSESLLTDALGFTRRRAGTLRGPRRAPWRSLYL